MVPMELFPFIFGSHMVPHPTILKFLCHKPRKSTLILKRILHLSCTIHQVQPTQGAPPLPLGDQPLSASHPAAQVCPVQLTLEELVWHCLQALDQGQMAHTRHLCRPLPSRSSLLGTAGLGWVRWGKWKQINSVLNTQSFFTIPSGRHSLLNQGLKLQFLNLPMMLDVYIGLFDIPCPSAHTLASPSLEMVFFRNCMHQQNLSKNFTVVKWIQ